MILVVEKDAEVAQLIVGAIDRARPSTPAVLRPTCTPLARFFQLTRQLSSGLPNLVILGPLAAKETTEVDLKALRITVGGEVPVPVVALAIDRLPLLSADAVYEFELDRESAKATISDLLDSWLP